MFELSIDGRIGRLALDRAEARNAIPVAGWSGLAEAAEAAAARGAAVLLVEGRGSAFCAGADLADFPAMHGDPAAAARFREAMRGGIERLAALPVPTVALVHGPCFGAGVALAMACDLRLVGPAAQFAITPAKFGISYPQEDIARLVALVGPGHASRLLLGAQPLDAGEALRIGLADGRLEEAEELVRALLANSPDSLAALKAGIALAARGLSSDSGQDRSFDTLLASDTLAGRLAALRRRP